MEQKKMLHQVRQKDVKYSKSLIHMKNMHLYIYIKHRQ